MASLGAAAESVEVYATGYGFDPPLEEIEYYLKSIFPVLRSGVEAKRGVEFLHSTRNASEFGGKWGTECFNKFPLPTLLCDEYSVKLIY